MPKSAKRSSAPSRELLPGLVIASHGRHYKVLIESGEVLEAHRRGKRGDVCVGDHVQCTPPDSGVAAIEVVEERRNLLYRSDEWRIKTLAANVNQVCIIFASRPTFNPWFIWKALLAASQAGIDAVVVRNKVELAEGATEAAEAISLLKSIGEKTMEVSALEHPEETEARLLEILQGKTTLFVGQSGMGKSTLLNLLIPHATAATREFSVALNLGKQTTTAAQWYDAKPDGWDGAIIDTPGFQEFGLAHLSLNDILRAMPDIREHVTGCRFFYFRHLHEPGCNVKAALEAGLISPARYEFYSSIATYADTTKL